MKVLEIDGNCTYFVVGERKVKPEEMTREDLLLLLSNIYEKNESTEIPAMELLESIKNPVEKEIVKQIIQKISEFKDNVEDIKQEIESQFPDIEI
ncbi:hypothetical protein QYM42_08495 [Lactococcus lactis]|uniref:hypothetical protein n=1 Tax=Lactococcus lactis TaxID=1358 RepID=UPI002657D5EE|nr:hypothetical protein [Lactococcus lactis]WKF72416.1 hypothetical protein QYM42_08495 [Lactococcus lactis]